MARADLVYYLAKYGLEKDVVNVRKIAEAICSEEKAKQHNIFADKIKQLLLKNISSNNNTANSIQSRGDIQNYIYEKNPSKELKDLILSSTSKEIIETFIQEFQRADLLRSYGVEPRNKLLFVGPPGNGKTSLAEAIAEKLMLPFLTVRYENIIGSYLGETASRLAKLFDYVKTQSCVLFFDEFETIGKERGDTNETGEIKRVVSSLLMQMDSLPSYVIVIAATNHDVLLDKATWRRFQIKLEIPKPTEKDLIEFYKKFEQNRDFMFGVKLSELANKTYGLSYSEVEEFALSVYRSYVLKIPNADNKKITESSLKNIQIQVSKIIQEGK